MFEHLQAEISLLLTQMEEQPDDVPELYEKLREKLNEMRATGMPLPQDLVDLEAKLATELFGDKA